MSDSRQKDQLYYLHVFKAPFNPRRWQFAITFTGRTDGICIQANRREDTYPTRRAAEVAGRDYAKQVGWKVTKGSSDVYPVSGGE